jgi:Membrane protein of unknown function.
MLMLTAWLGQKLGIDFRVDGFWPAFLGALVVSSSPSSSPGS